MRRGAGRGRTVRSTGGAAGAGEAVRGERGAGRNATSGEADPGGATSEGGGCEQCDLGGSGARAV
jgi:hypothetical protein